MHVFAQSILAQSMLTLSLDLEENSIYVFVSTAFSFLQPRKSFTSLQVIRTCLNIIFSSKKIRNSGIDVIFLLIWNFNPVSDAAYLFPCRQRLPARI